MSPSLGVAGFTRRAVERGLELAWSYLGFLESKYFGEVPHDLRTVCIILGPYRNLTTLTATAVFMHPSCRVLNHAGRRILPLPPVNFLRDYTDEKFDNFVRYAISLSSGGRRGSYGGSITLSHAFDHEAVRQIHSERSTEYRTDGPVRCLLWKESMMVSDVIKDEEDQLADLLAKNGHFRFLLPIRNPLDCAVSNHRTGHASFLVDRKPSLPKVMEAILDELAWFLDLEEDHPKRFFHFFEDGFSEDMLRRLAGFLEVEPEAAWIEDAMACYQLQPPYAHDPALVQAYRESIARRFAGRPRLLARFATFADPEYYRGKPVRSTGAASTGTPSAVEAGR